MSEKEFLLHKLIGKQNEYIELLGKEIADSMSIAAIHGYQSKHTLAGVKLRLEINDLKDNLRDRK